MTPDSTCRHPSADLRPLLQTAEATVPGMTGEIGEPGPEQIFPGHRAAVETLVAGIAARAPEAGAAYPPVRAWTMMTWQPVVLAILAAHRLALAPSLDRLRQTVTKGGAVFGYRLPPQPDAPPRDEATRIALLGLRVRALADALLADLAEVAPLKPVLARRLLADRFLSTVVHQNLSAATGEAWLAAAGLTGDSALGTVEGRDGLVVRRRACCLEYLVAGGKRCETCPTTPACIPRPRQRVQ